MGKLSVISDATTIACNVSSTLSRLEAHYDIHNVRQAGNKLAYSLKTINNGRQLIDILGFEGRDLQRAEILMDAFTVKARDEILKS